MRKNFIIIILLSAFLSLNFAAFSYSKTDSVQKNPASQPVLSMLETGLDSNTSQEGEEFSAKLMEDVLSDGQVVIPKDSIVYGSVTKVKKSGKFSKDAYIQLKITQISTPDEKIISIEDKPMLVEVCQPIYNNKKENFLKKLPGTIAGSATSILLGKFCSFADTAVWAMSTGAEMTAGLISGIVSPDEGKSREESSTQRALDSSPLGSVGTFIKKGDDICLNPGQCFCIFFDKETVEYIKENIL